MTKATWIPTAIAVLACAVCIAVAQQPPVAKKIPNAAEEQLKERPQLLPPTSNALPGRYQATYGGAIGHFIVIDTHTGHCWEKSGSRSTFKDLGSPVATKD